MIRSDIRVPGSYVEVDASGANSALPAYRQKILVVAPRIATPAAWAGTTAYTVGQVVRPTANSNNYFMCIVAGTTAASEPTWPAAGGSVADGTVTWREFVTAKDIAAVHIPVDCFSADDGAKYAGSGSLAHRIVRAIKRQFEYAEVTLILVDDDVSAVKATGSIAIAGTATASGTIDLYIGNEKISYSYSAGATNTAIASAIDALIASSHDLAASPSVASGTITLHAKNGGTPGNLLGRWNAGTSRYEPVVIKTSGDGITVTVTGFSGGATDPDLEDAFTAATADAYALIVTPYAGADQIADLRAYLLSVSNEINCRGARAWIGITSSIAAATTLADVNYERIHVPFVRRCKTPAYELAAMVAADHAAVGHPAKPLNYRELIHCDAPEIADRFEWSEINSLLWNGVTPYNADNSGRVRCVRSITTYKTNASGTPDPLYLDTTTIANLDYTRQAVKARHELEFSGMALRENHVDGEPEFIVTPGDIRSVNIDVCMRLEKYGVLQQVKVFKDRFVSVRDSNVQGRINSDIPVEVVQGLHVLANSIRIVTSN